MLNSNRLSFDRSVEVLKAVAEPTRLRLVLLLARNDLTVSDLTSILGQSQPRISRHLKLLVEAGVLARYQEGAWAYFRLADDATIAALVHAMIGRIDASDRVLTRDAERLQGVREERSRRASSYFARNAGRWDLIRSLHAPDADVEWALAEAVGSKRIEAHLDLGTGTGRVLELFADRCGRAVGVDASREMLAVARAKLDEAGIKNAQVRQGDVYHLPVERDAFDLVTVHQVLHYLDDPAAAIREAAAALAPGGRIAVVDFAPHDLEFLRADHAHMRLGFGHEAVSAMLEDAGLDVLSVRDLRPEREAESQLTVTIWVAEDPRRFVADAASSQLRSAIA